MWKLRFELLKNRFGFGVQVLNVKKGSVLGSVLSVKKVGVPGFGSVPFGSVRITAFYMSNNHLITKLQLQYNGDRQEKSVVWFRIM